MANSIEERLKEVEARAIRAEKIAQRAQDVQEIQNLVSRHSFMDAQGKNREQVHEIFAQTVPDVSLCFHNTSIYKGLDNIIHYYCDNWEKKMKPKMLEDAIKMFPEIANKKENEMVGFMKMHANCSPYIIVAGDGKTAKGTWESPGFVTQISGDKVAAMWMWERFAVDFLKENGKWKIWHFNGMIQFGTPFDKSWVQTAMENKPIIDPGEKREPEPAVSVIWNEGYSPRKLCGPNTPNFPLQPVPYETFSETFSYLNG